MSASSRKFWISIRNSKNLQPINQNIWVNREYSHFENAVDSMRTEMGLSHSPWGRNPQSVLSPTMHYSASFVSPQESRLGCRRENKAHRGSPCSGKKSLLALAGQWKTHSVSMAAPQLLQKQPPNGIQVRPETHQAHTPLWSLEAGDRAGWSCWGCKLALTYFLNFWKTWVAKELKKI